MKSKILAELKKKFPGLSNEFLGFIASKLEAKVTEEKDIEGAITALDEALPIKEQAEFFQKQGDKRVTEALAKKVEEDKKKKKNPNANEEIDDDDITDDDDIDEPGAAGGNPKPSKGKKKPSVNSLLLKKFDELALKVTGMEKDKTQAKYQEELKKQLTDKKIPLSFAKGKVVESNEQLEEVLAEIEADFDGVKQELVNEGLTIGKPLAGSGGVNASKKASKEEVDDVLKNIL